VRDTVMGSPDGGGIRGSVSAAGGQAQDLTGRASDAASSAADQLREAPEALRENVQGNPLAAGLIAFGGGLLLGSILPPTAAEKRMASSMAENLEPVVGQAMGAAEELKSGMQETVRDAAEEVKEHAKGAAQEIKEEARGAAQDVKDQAKGSAEDMKDEAKGAAQDAASSVRQQGSREPRIRPPLRFVRLVVHFGEAHARFRGYPAQRHWRLGRHDEDRTRRSVAVTDSGALVTARRRLRHESSGVPVIARRPLVTASVEVARLVGRGRHALENDPRRTRWETERRPGSKRPLLGRSPQSPWSRA
jgi:uncharacterized protein YjbJ (UPF0337 family)